MKQQLGPPRTPQEDPGNTSKTIGIDSLEGPRSLDLSGEAYSNRPRRWGIPRGAFLRHREFVRNCPLRCCLIYSLITLLRNSAFGPEIGFRAGVRPDSSRESVAILAQVRNRFGSKCVPHRVGCSPCPRTSAAAIGTVYLAGREFKTRVRVFTQAKTKT